MVFFPLLGRRHSRVTITSETKSNGQLFFPLSFVCRFPPPLFSPRLVHFFSPLPPPLWSRPDGNIFSILTVRLAPIIRCTSTVFTGFNQVSHLLFLILLLLDSPFSFHRLLSGTVQPSVHSNVISPFPDPKASSLVLLRSQDNFSSFFFSGYVHSFDVSGCFSVKTNFSS